MNRLWLFLMLTSVVSDVAISNTTTALSSSSATRDVAISNTTTALSSSSATRDVAISNTTILLSSPSATRGTTSHSSSNSSSSTTTSAVSSSSVKLDISPSLSSSVVHPSSSVIPDNQCFNSSLHNSSIVNQQCENRQGNHSCVCNGSGLVNGSCQCNYTNECLNSSLYNCSIENQHCENRPGNHRCVCIDVYVWVGGTYVHIHLCVYISNNCNCVWIHVYVVVNGICRQYIIHLCLDGNCNYVYINGTDAVNGTCRSVSPSPSSAVALQSAISAISPSPSSPVVPPSSSVMQDINECSNKTLNKCSQNCINKPGSYACSCNPGYKLNSDGYACDDIDECALNRDDCMQTCNNTVGGFTCGCNEFFKLNVTNNKTCEAKIKCNESSNACEQICFVANGTEKCECNRGYQLSNDNKTCVDKNECNNKNGGCAQTCRNTNGSFTCECWSGYLLQADGFTCKDINECLNSSLYNCSIKNQQCENRPGNYSCICINGYVLANGTCQLIPTTKPPTVNTPNPAKNALNVTFDKITIADWNSGVDQNFKEAVASALNKHCNSKCGSKRKRRSTPSYTASNVKILPGYPRNLSNPDRLLVSFYVSNPSGSSLLPAAALYDAVSSGKADIEKAVGTSLSVQLPPSLVTAPPGSPKTTKAPPKDWIWILTGVLVGVFVIIIIIVIVVLVKRKRARKVGNVNSNRGGYPLNRSVDEGEGNVQLREVHHQ